MHGATIRRVKWSRYRPGVAQRVGRGIALLFHDHDTRRGWVVGSTPRPHLTPGKDPVPILQEPGWDLGAVWTGWKSFPNGIRSRKVQKMFYYILPITNIVFDRLCDDLRHNHYKDTKNKKLPKYMSGSTQWLTKFSIWPQNFSLFTVKMR